MQLRQEQAIIEVASMAAQAAGIAAGGGPQRGCCEAPWHTAICRNPILPVAQPAAFPRFPLRRPLPRRRRAQHFELRCSAAATDAERRWRRGRRGEAHGYPSAVVLKALSLQPPQQALQVRSGLQAQGGAGSGAGREG